MQVENRWAQPVTFDLVSLPFDGNHHLQNSLEQSKEIPILTPVIPIHTSSNLFPPQRVEPIDMPRPQQNRTKTGYTQSATIDETHANAPYMQNVPIQHVTHPADRSSILIFLQRLSTLGFILLISLPCVILLTLFIPICWLGRILIRCLCRHRCSVIPCTCTYLSANDLFWFYNSNMRKNPGKDGTITKFNCQSVAPIAAAIFFLDGTVNENSLKKLLINRLITNSVRRGSNIGRKLFPRFSQLIVPHFSGTMWIDYELFSIDEHVREIPRPIQTDDDLQKYISTLVSTELTLTRPLWQLYYKNRSTSRPNDSILVFIYHPVLSDGISLMRILLKYVVDNRTTQLDLKPRFVGRRGGDHIFDYIKAYLFGHMLLLGKLFFNSSTQNFLKRSMPMTTNQNLITTHSPSYNSFQSLPQRIVTWSPPFSLTQANRMKLVTRTRMNDLLSSLVVSCVRLYMERHGVSNSPNINCIIPCDLRSNTPNIPMGNQIAHIRLELPMHIEGNIPRLWSFHDSTKRAKENGDYATMYLFTRISYLLFPLCLANRIMARMYNNASLWLTTLAAGSSTTLATMSLCNKDVRSLICLGPSVGTASVSFCVTTYADEVRLAIIADSNIVPDPHILTHCFIEQLNIVQDLLAHRRIPGEIRRVTRPPRLQPPKKSISSISEMSDDLSIEEIQAKMTSLQQELLSLKSQFENVDANEPSSQNQRLIITSKLEELRREFRELLIKLQERQCELSGMIPSDEEDEMDPHVRVRLRSASVASRISLRSNDQRPIAIATARSSRIYQLEKDEASETGVIPIQQRPRSSASSSKMSLTPQQTTEQQQQQQQQQAGMRRAQSVSICENTRIDPQQRLSLTRTRPTTPSKTTTVTTINPAITIVQIDPGDT